MRDRARRVAAFARRNRASSARDPDAGTGLSPHSSSANLASFIALLIIDIIEARLCRRLILAAAKIIVS